MERSVQAALESLRAEVLTFKGFPDDEALALIQDTCGSVLSTRREAAAALIQQVGWAGEEQLSPIIGC